LPLYTTDYLKFKGFVPVAKTVLAKRRKIRTRLN